MSTGYLVPIDDAESRVAFWADVIDAYSDEDDVVLVPFADDTAEAEAALELNRRVVLFVRTPARLLRLETRFQPPSVPAWQRALADLAATTKRDAALNTYINSLYETACPECGSSVSALAFIWDIAQASPVGKELSCPTCGFQGRAPTNTDDVVRAARFDARGLNYWFILEWLADAQDALGRELARDLVDSYSPRNLTALADITRKIDAELADDSLSQHWLRAAMLHALDAGRQTPIPTQPGHVMERNVWQLLEAGLTPGQEKPVPDLVSDLGEFFADDPTGRIALVSGPIRRLTRQLRAGGVKLILGPPPSLDVDSWTCEQMWSRWVFGRGALEGLHPPVGGWPRHVRALAATVAAVQPALGADGRAVFRFNATNPDRASALLVAMAPHAILEALVFQPPVVQPTNLFRTVGGTYQMTFAPADPESASTDPDALSVAIEDLAVEAARQVISARGEPVTYDWLVTASLARLADAGLLRAAVQLDLSVSPLAFVKQHVRQGLRAALSDGRLATAPVGPGEEPGHWCLSQRSATRSLAARVEAAVTELLSTETSITRADVYREFPGALTPEAELVDALLAAYGEQRAAGEWRRRLEPDVDRGQVVQTLLALGEQLKYAVEPQVNGAIWRDDEGGVHTFHVLENARWQKAAVNGVAPTSRCYLVVAESVANLIAVKLSRDPLLRADFAARHCSVIKVHHLLGLAETPGADRQALKKIVGLDPIIEQAEAQMPLF